MLNWSSERTTSGVTIALSAKPVKRANRGRIAGKDSGERQRGKSGERAHRAHFLQKSAVQPVFDESDPMNESLNAQVEGSLTQLRALIERGRELYGLLASDSSDAFATTANGVWQQECGVIVNELSGGSKAHWLARAFSEAFLLRSESGGSAHDAPPAEIVNRLIAVLERAVAALSNPDATSIASASAAPPAPHRFDFIHNTEIRPVLEQAYRDSKRAFEQGRYDLALQTSCGVLEAIVTDALEHKGLAALSESGAPAGKIGDWAFQTRLMVAERAGFIRGGWARLPAVAWTYRDPAQGESTAITERDAKLAAQVLNVVMRDLNPGR